jgi:peptidyl-prolyl cis-trans isomerase B (cyclophilin B)
MAKTKKNSNYQTERRAAAQAEAERKAKSAKRRKILTAVLIPAVCVLLIVASILTIVGKKSGWWRDPLAVTNYVTFVIMYENDEGVKDSAEITIEIYGDEAPETAENFINLCKSGYYDGTVFHRIVDGFVAQGGNGADTPNIDGEFDENGFTNRIPHVRGTISMARLGNDMNSANSQFFVVLETSENNTKSLDGKYASFGKVIKGMAFFDLISDGVNDDRGIPYKGERPKILSAFVETPEEYAQRTADI